MAQNNSTEIFYTSFFNSKQLSNQFQVYNQQIKNNQQVYIVNYVSFVCLDKLFSPTPAFIYSVFIYYMITV